MARSTATSTVPSHGWKVTGLGTPSDMSIGSGISGRAAADRPGIPLPVDMSDGVPNPVTFRRWDGSVELAVDRAIQDTRSVIYPLHGLDAYDPRD